MPKVLIIGPGRHDYGPAAQHGELVSIMDTRVNPFNTDELRMQLEHELFEVNAATGEDMLLFCGNPCLNAITVGLFMQRFGRFKMLIYGAKHHDYVVRDIAFNGNA